MTEWRDIESAPKDGTEFLAVYSSGQCHEFSIVSWDGKGFVGMCEGSRAIEHVSDFGTDYLYPFVTHWQPLPQPPK